MSHGSYIVGMHVPSKIVSNALFASREENYVDMISKFEVLLRDVVLLHRSEAARAYRYTLNDIHPPAPRVTLYQNA